ncbi:MFS transporter [Paraneptunicella aestuarii]|uniref:MFS transporter n=1 Tax=Paraneptunicella aestuarii TaxID=2831148 RepID=UPI001E303B71|nr:MFS transporter [Paraneptunicella aestuarii]UAA40315.1 MFS transporter [Paraneptunicella aestuarii]
MQKTKPELSFLQIFNMCFGFMGIQFGFALQNANVSRIFETLGADYNNLAILWIAAPITGLIVQPIIGHMSDNTWNRLGRRRPYFLWGALAACAALIVMPNSPYLWMAAGMLWIMDASINVSMEPFRAFVGDMLPKQQRATGYAMQSFFIGIGATVASAMPYVFAEYMNVSNTTAAGEIPDTVKYSFYFGAVAFFLAVLWTIVSTKEYSPEQLQAFEDAEKEENPHNAGHESTVRSAEKYIRAGATWTVVGVAVFTIIKSFQDSLDKQLFILAGLIFFFGIAQLVAGFLSRNKPTTNAFNSMMNDLFSMPETMKQLAWVQFFSWFPLFAMWIYSTSAVTSYHYGSSDVTSELYNQGANWVGVLFGAYNGFAAIAAIIIPILVRMTNLRIAHLINLVLGGAGLASFMVIKDPQWLILSMVGVGFAWASILSVPYALLANALPNNKMGIYMGIFNFFITLPQILAASILGFMVSVIFDNQPIYALLIGGISMVIAGLLVLRVKETS